MISEFSFESPVLFDGREEVLPAMEAGAPLALQLPLRLPGEMLNLEGVAPNWQACRDHFAGLDLTWRVEADRVRRGTRALATLAVDAVSGAIWSLQVLEQAGTGRHRHGAGGPYGECVITLAGELHDATDDGTCVALGRGAVMFHAPETIHEATAVNFWVGLIHQPCGATKME